MVDRARDELLVDYVRARGSATVAELSRETGVSPSSIRRVLQRLARNGRLLRTYGGAASAERSGMRGLGESVRAISEKRRIAIAAASLIQDGQTIAITSGSTCFELARQLVGRTDLTVITNSLDVANELIDRDGIQLVVLGGVARPRMHSLLGHLTEQACRELRADTLFMGIGAVSVERGLMNDYMPEVETDRALRPIATTVIVLADSAKFDMVGPAFVFGLDEVDTIVTDPGVSASTIDALEQRGVKVIVG
jgi:DeoR/GlpR family transcriptional regulator of sugar metabolism